MCPAAVALVCALIIAACGSSSSTRSSTRPPTAASSTTTATTKPSGAGGVQIGYEGVPLEQGPDLAPANTTGTGKVDGIACAPVERLAYHIHAHLAVFDNGQQYSLPAGIGIPGSRAVQTKFGPIAAGGRCFYWLHTHTSDGVIHIESPTKALYTLGNFFDVWRQPLGSDRVGSLRGTITAIVNGRAWSKNPRQIPLLPHEDIQLNMGDPIPPIVTVDWSRTQL